MKWRPSEADRLALRNWRYEPWNLGTYPSDVMEDGSVAEQLQSISTAVLRAMPRLHKTASPEQVLKRLRRESPPAWCEARWIGDYERHLDQ